MITLFLYSMLFVAIYMTIVYLIALKKDDLSIIDVGYGPGFVVAGTAQMIVSNNISVHFIAVYILIAIWAMRLALQIGIRKLGKGEDFRYTKMRKDFGKNWKIISYIKVFLFQGLIILLIESPLFFIAQSDGIQTGILFYTGIIVWAIGFFFESISDLQKFVFKKRGNKGIIRTGLWKYSRHPNYFGEITLWWGIFLIALETSLGCFSLISPVLITTLLIMFSGIPLLEKRYKDNPEYQEYKKRTSILIPWFPKKERKG